MAICSWPWFCYCSIFYQIISYASMKLISTLFASALEILFKVIRDMFSLPFSMRDISCWEIPVLCANSFCERFSSFLILRISFPTSSHTRSRTKALSFLNRTPFSLYLSSSLSYMACQKITLEAFHLSFFMVFLISGQRLQNTTGSNSLKTSSGLFLRPKNKAAVKTNLLLSESLSIFLASETLVFLSHNQSLFIIYPLTVLL